MWRRDLCGARLGKCVRTCCSAGPKRHMTFCSETTKKLHDARVRAPHFSLACFPARITGRQRFRLHLKIDFGIDVEGEWPSCDAEHASHIACASCRVASVAFESSWKERQRKQDGMAV